MAIIIRTCNCEDFGYKFTVLVCVKMLQHIALLTCHFTDKI